MQQDYYQKFNSFNPLTLNIEIRPELSPRSKPILKLLSFEKFE